MPIKLYENPMSANARKVRLLAAELGIPLERVTLDFRTGDFRSPEYLARNPNGKVPTLDHDGFVLWESGAILKYLAAQRPERGLVPSDPREQAITDQWLLWFTAHLEPAINQILQERRIKPFRGQPGNDPTLIGEAQSALDRFLPILDRQLAGKEYIVGKLGIVDFVVAPVLDMAPALQIDVDRYANLTAWLARMQGRSYWKDT
ncbi:MAG TPA: glutathione S-transferase family protein [Haliangium sp.]|nr:glutathione S-transferase family protein [Haliangium sp.]